MLCPRVSFVIQMSIQITYPVSHNLIIPLDFHPRNPDDKSSFSLDFGGASAGSYLLLLLLRCWVWWMWSYLSWMDLVRVGWKVSVEIAINIWWLKWNSLFIQGLRWFNARDIGRYPLWWYLVAQCRYLEQLVAKPSYLLRYQGISWFLCLYTIVCCILEVCIFSIQNPGVLVTTCYCRDVVRKSDRAREQDVTLTRVDSSWLQISPLRFGSVLSSSLESLLYSVSELELLDESLSKYSCIGPVSLLSVKLWDRVLPAGLFITVVRCGYFGACFVDCWSDSRWIYFRTIRNGIAPSSFPDSLLNLRSLENFACGSGVLLRCNFYIVWWVWCRSIRS